MSFISNICYSSFPDRLVCNALSNTVEQSAYGFLAKPIFILIHELGHLITINLLFDRSKATIKLKNLGYSGGEVHYIDDYFSKLGGRIGAYNSRVLVAVSGPIAQITASLALLILYPGNGLSYVSLSQNAAYAVSALFKKTFYEKEPLYRNTIQHDYVAIKRFKPGFYAEAFIVISVALMIFGMYSLIDQSFTTAYCSPLSATV